MIVNINYAGHFLGDIEKLSFSRSSPQMHVLKCKNFTIVLFRSKKCRIMGCRKPLANLNELPYPIKLHRIASATATFSIGRSIILHKLSAKVKCIYEPELFPALRLVDFNPMCVNIFGSGKVVITGLKILHHCDIIADIKATILPHL